MKHKIIFLSLMVCFLLAISAINMRAANGDVFVVQVPIKYVYGSSSQTAMRFIVLDEAKKWCEVYATIDEDMNQINPAISQFLEAKVTIPSKVNGYTVLSIGKKAFYHCSITGVEFPNTIEYIKSSAFAYCKNLKSVDIPFCEGGTAVYSDVFCECENLESVHLPESVYAPNSEGWFTLCYALSDVTLDEGMPEIPPGCFYGCTSLRSVIIPNSIVYIGASAFYGCSLDEIVFDVDNSMTTGIGDNAFYHCPLKRAVLPEWLSNIGEGAFSSTLLQSVVIPAHTSNIGDKAFFNNPSLKDVYICRSTIPAVSSTGEAFSDIHSDAVLHVSNPNDYQGVWLEWFSAVEAISSVYDVLFEGYTWPVGGQECDYEVTASSPGIKNIKVEYGQPSGEWMMFYEPPYVPGPNENFQLHITVSLYKGLNFAPYGNYGYILMDNGTWQTCNSTTSVSDTEYTYIWNVRASAPEGGIDIPSISLYVFDPVVGQAPYNGILSIMPFSGNLKGCLSSGVSWMVLENGYWYVMDPGELFENLKSYRVKIDLKTMSGYNFIADAPAFVNGEEAEYVISNDDPNKAFVWYDFMYIGTPTDINAPQVQDTPAAWYSLDGRRLDNQPSQKGIYIHGGKKVVVK